MTKEDFFNKSERERKLLIYKAHLYYIDPRRDIKNVDPDVGEFILMCEYEAWKRAKKEALKPI